MGFQQPIHVSRLRKFELADLDLPINDEPLWLELMKGSTWIKGKVTSQSATGKVLVDLVDTGPEWVDLISTEYRWIYTPADPHEEERPCRRLRRLRSVDQFEGQGDS